MHEESKLTPSKYDDFFEAFWDNTEIHKQAVRGNITGILEQTFKEVAWSGWAAHAEIFPGPYLG